MEYRVTVVRSLASLEQLGEAWAQLLGRSQSGSIFASYAWNLSWWHSFGAGKRLYVLVATDSEAQIRGIAPLMLDRLGPLRRLRFIGTGLSDTGDFLLDASCASECGRAIYASLRRRRREWDLLDLDEVPPYSAMSMWLEGNRPPGLHVTRLPRTDAPYIALPATWKEYTATLGRKPRQHLESFSRRVVEERDLSFRLVTEGEDVPAAVARFYKLHLARWSTKEDLLNPEHRSPDFFAFLEEACERSAAEGSLRLAELCAGDEVIASWISFQVQGRLNGYMTGFDPAWSKERPGKILHGFVVRQALAEGAQELDFGRGAEEYKYEMGATNRQNARFLLTNNTPRSGLALGMLLLRVKLGPRVRKLVEQYREKRTPSAT